MNLLVIPQKEFNKDTIYYEYGSPTANINPLYFAPGGLYDVSYKVTGTITSGDILIKTKEYSSGDYATKVTISAIGEGSYTSEITDNHFIIESSSLIGTDIKIEVILKKKIVEEGEGVTKLASWADKPVVTVADNGKQFLFAEAVTGQGGECFMATVCDGVIKPNGRVLLYSSDLSGTPNSSFVKVDDFIIPSDMISKNISLFSFLNGSNPGSNSFRELKLEVASSQLALFSSGGTNLNNIPINEVIAIDASRTAYSSQRFGEAYGSNTTSTALQATGDISVDIFIKSTVASEVISLYNFEVYI